MITKNNVLKFIIAVIKDIFVVSFITFVVFFILELVRPGFVSNYISFILLLIIPLISGTILVLIKQYD